MSKGHSGSLLTVAELIEKLRKMPQDAVVYTEGTEAEAEATEVINRGNGTVLIEGEAFHGRPWRKK